MNAPDQHVAAVDRRKFIGGSDAAAILGISPWRSPYQVWQDKTTPAMPEITDPGRLAVLNRGKRMEPYVLDLLQEETGLIVVRRNSRYIDPELPFLACEVDGESEAGENIEIKTVSPFKAKEWGEEKTDAIPVHYTAQAMHGLMITGRAVCIFGVLIGGDDFRVYRVERDDETIAALREKEIRFWREHVEALVPPPPASHADIAAMFQRDSGGVVAADNDTARAVFELRALKAEAKEIASRTEAVELAIKKAMGEAAVLTVDDVKAATWKTQQARRFDQKAFQAAHPDLYDQFIKTTESRVFRLA